MGLFGVGNIGNDASLEAALSAIRRLVPLARCRVVCGRPTVVADAFGVETEGMFPLPRAGRFRPKRRLLRLPYLLAVRLPAELFAWGRVFRRLRNVDHLIVPGTGILDDFGMPNDSVRYELLRRSTAPMSNQLLERRRGADLPPDEPSVDAGCYPPCPLPVVPRRGLPGLHAEHRSRRATGSGNAGYRVRVRLPGRSPSGRHRVGSPVDDRCGSDDVPRMGERSGLRARHPRDVRRADVRPRLVATRRTPPCPSSHR
jgi:hypothetical protein